jgi:hypothetical protein
VPPKMRCYDAAKRCSRVSSTLEKALDLRALRCRPGALPGRTESRRRTWEAHLFRRHRRLLAPVYFLRARPRLAAKEGAATKYPGMSGSRGTVALSMLQAALSVTAAAAITTRAARYATYSATCVVARELEHPCPDDNALERRRRLRLLDRGRHERLLEVRALIALDWQSSSRWLLCARVVSHCAGREIPRRSSRGISEWRPSPRDSIRRST